MKYVRMHVRMFVLYRYVYTFLYEGVYVLPTSLGCRLEAEVLDAALRLFLATVATNDSKGTR